MHFKHCRAAERWPSTHTRWIGKRLRTASPTDSGRALLSSCSCISQEWSSVHSPHTHVSVDMTLEPAHHAAETYNEQFFGNSVPIL